MRKKHLIWLSLGVLALVIGLLFRWNPSQAESWYGNGVFVWIRWIIAHTLGILPFPAITLIAISCVILFYFTAMVPLIKKQWSFRSFIGGLLATAGGAVFLFQFLWGFNYARPTWDERLHIEVKGMTVAQLIEEFHRATDSLETALSKIEDVRLLAYRSNLDHEQSIEPVLRKVLSEHGFNVAKSPRVRIVRPKGILMRWNTAGIYVPFSGEGHVDAGMLPVQIPFTLAHEMAHGFGVTDEGDCNFLAYLTCNASDDPYVRFAGLFTYWRYVAGEYRYILPDDYKLEYDQLPEMIRTLLLEIRENDKKYPDLFPKLRNTVYDTYLKSQGVTDGLQSYSRVVQLVWAYERRRVNKN